MLPEKTSLLPVVFQLQVVAHPFSMSVRTKGSKVAIHSVATFRLVGAWFLVSVEMVHVASISFPASTGREVKRAAPLPLKGIPSIVALSAQAVAKVTIVCYRDEWSLVLVSSPPVRFLVGAKGTDALDDGVRIPTIWRS